MSTSRRHARRSPNLKALLTVAEPLNRYAVAVGQKGVWLPSRMTRAVGLAHGSLLGRAVGR